MSSETKQIKEPAKGHSLLAFNPLRISFALYFFVYAYVVAKSLIPLPDEPPRINFWGLFCVVTGLIVSFNFLVTRYRLFLFGVICFLPLAAWQMADKIKFLEMMLESTDVVKVTRYSLGFVMLLLLTPPVWRLFDKQFSRRERRAPVLMKRGFPF